MRASYNTGMSVADGMPPAISLPADPDFRASRDREARNNHLRRGAIIAAALAHVAVITAMIVHWPNLFPVRPLAPPPIAVTLVTEPPPPPPQARRAPPPPAPPPQQERVSGADTKTAAPPPPVEKGEEAAPKPTPPPPAEAQTKTAVPDAKPAPQDKTRQAKPKVASRETTPKPARGAVNRAPGDRATEGDPYLNLLFSLIEAHRNYPRNAVGSLGLPLEGTSVYLIAVRSDGALTNVVLERSSGAPILDQTALDMIKRAAPFPPPPQHEFPGPGVVLEVTIHLFPGMG
jgi:periplasmic protein TonB